MNTMTYKCHNCEFASNNATDAMWHAEDNGHNTYNVRAIKEEIVRLTFIRRHLIMVEPLWDSTAVEKVDAKLATLRKIIGNETFNAEEYGA